MNKKMRQLDDYSDIEFKVKNRCVSCDVEIELDNLRYIERGNYCSKCNSILNEIIKLKQGRARTKGEDLKFLEDKLKELQNQLPNYSDIKLLED